MTLASILNLAVCVGVAQPQTAAPAAMTIDQAAAIAERNAFAVRIQSTTVEKDRQAIVLALSSLGPNVALSTTATQYGQEITASFGAGQAPSIIQPFNTALTTLSLSVPLDISGNLTRLYGASKASYDSARRSLESTFNDARLNARSAFLTVLRDQALVVVAQLAVKDAQDRLHQSQLEFAQQQVAKVDVDRLDAQVAQSNSDLLNAQNTLQLAKNAFNQVLARPIETPVDLVDVSSQPPIPGDVNSVSKQALENRPDAQALVDQIRSLALIRRAQEAGMNPSMSLGLSYSRDLNPTFLSGNPNSVTGSLTLNLPIYDSGATRARVREARQDESSAKIQLQQLQLSISQDVQSAITSMLSAQARLANAERQVDLAQEVYRLSQVRQDAGEGTSVEVVDAESSLEQSRNSLVSAKYDYFLAYSQLQHAVGVDRITSSQAAPTQPVPASGVKK